MSVLFLVISREWKNNIVVCYNHGVQEHEFYTKIQKYNFQKNHDSYWWKLQTTIRKWSRIIPIFRLDCQGGRFRLHKSSDICVTITNRFKIEFNPNMVSFLFQLIFGFSGYFHKANINGFLMNLFLSVYQPFLVNQGCWSWENSHKDSILYIRLATGHSWTGIIHFVANITIDCNTKLQYAIDIVSCGSKYATSRIRVSPIAEVFINLRCRLVSIADKSHLFELFELG